MSLRTGAATTALLFAALAPALSRAATFPWLDPALPLQARVAALLARMTMPQKLAYIHGTSGPFDGYVPGIPELGVPPLDMGDGPAGIRSAIVSSALPMPLALAATWNVDLAQSYGDALGREARALGVNTLLAPTINVARVPVAAATSRASARIRTSPRELPCGRSRRSRPATSSPFLSTSS